MQKKGLPCECGSGRLHYRCCGKDRRRGSSPEGSLELIRFLRNSPDSEHSKKVLKAQTHLSRYNLDAGLKWCINEGLVRLIDHRRASRRRFVGDRDAIDAWLARSATPREAPRRRRGRPPKANAHHKTTARPSKGQATKKDAAA